MERGDLQLRFISSFFIRFSLMLTIGYTHQSFPSKLSFEHFPYYFQVTLSVLLTAAGVLIAALGDFSFDLVGYSMAFISVFFQVCFLLLH